MLRLTMAFHVPVCLFHNGKFYLKIFEMRGDQKVKNWKDRGGGHTLIGKSVGVVIPYNEIRYYPGSFLEWLVETMIVLKNIEGWMIER
jgi:hypothetical protein